MGCEDREPERGVSRGDRGNRSVDSDPGGERVIRGNFGPGGPKNVKKWPFFGEFRVKWAFSLNFGVSWPGP